MYIKTNIHSCTCSVHTSTHTYYKINIYIKLLCNSQTPFKICDYFDNFIQDNRQKTNKGKVYGAEKKSPSSLSFPVDIQFSNTAFSTQASVSFGLGQSRLSLLSQAVYSEVHRQILLYCFSVSIGLLSRALVYGRNNLKVMFSHISSDWLC